MYIGAIGHVFTVLLGVLWGLLLTMHGRAGRHAPITRLWIKQHANSACNIPVTVHYGKNIV